MRQIEELYGQNVKVVTNIHTLSWTDGDKEHNFECSNRISVCGKHK